MRPSAFILLAYLRSLTAEELAAVTWRGLAAACGMSPQTVTRCLRDLEASGHIDTRYSPGGGRYGGYRMRVALLTD